MFSRMESKRYSKEVTMSNEHKQAIAAVLRTLDQITVSGKDNLDMLLACMMTLESLMNEQDGENNG